LIEFSKHILENIDYLTEAIRELYYEALTLIIKRDELELAHICFDSEQYSKFLEVE